MSEAAKENEPEKQQAKALPLMDSDFASPVKHVNKKPRTGPGPTPRASTVADPNTGGSPAGGAGEVQSQGHGRRQRQRQLFGVKRFEQLVQEGFLPTPDSDIDWLHWILQVSPSHFWLNRYRTSCLF